MNRSTMMLSAALLTLSLSAGAALAKPFSSGAIAMKIRPLLAGRGVAVAGEGEWDETSFTISRGKGELRGHLRIGISHYLLRNIELVETEVRDVAPDGEEPVEGEPVKTFPRIEGFAAEIHALPEPEPEVVAEAGATEELDFDGLEGAAGAGDGAAGEEQDVAAAESASLGRIEVRIVLRGAEKPRRLLEGTASLDGETWTLMARPALPPMAKKPLVRKAKKMLASGGSAAGAAAEEDGADTAEDGF